MKVHSFISASAVNAMVSSQLSDVHHLLHRGVVSICLQILLTDAPTTWFKMQQWPQSQIVRMLNLFFNYNLNFVKFQFVSLYQHVRSLGLWNKIMYRPSAVI